jgi:hypothetical protein
MGILKKLKGAFAGRGTDILACLTEDFTFPHNPSADPVTVEIREVSPLLSFQLIPT